MSAGILLYAADIAMRMTQASNVTMVTGWRVIGKGANRAITFTLPVDKVCHTHSCCTDFLLDMLTMSDSNWLMTIAQLQWPYDRHIDKGLPQADLCTSSGCVCF